MADGAFGDLQLLPEQVGELLTATRRHRARPLHSIAPDSFALPASADVFTRVKHELRERSGCVIVRGFPVDLDTPELERMLWGWCSHLGTGVSQNSDLSLIHHVTDGAGRPRQGSRGVGSRRASKLHVDPTDYAVLLCVRQAIEDPPSWVTSSVVVWNELRRRRPDLVSVAERGFHWYRMGEHRADESPITTRRIPVFSRAGGRIACRYSPYWIGPGPAHGAPAFTTAEGELLELIDQIAFDHRVEFPLGPGDLEIVNNYIVLHGRAGHDHEPDESVKRLLLRVWLESPDAGPWADETTVRYGAIHHGGLGWTAAQLAAGEHLAGHGQNR